MLIVVAGDEAPAERDLCAAGIAHVAPKLIGVAFDGHGLGGLVVTSLYGHEAAQDIGGFAGAGGLGRATGEGGDGCTETDEQECFGFHRGANMREEVRTLGGILIFGKQEMGEIHPLFCVRVVLLWRAGHAFR